MSEHSNTEQDGERETDRKPATPSRALLYVMSVCVAFTAGGALIGWANGRLGGGVAIIMIAWPLIALMLQTSVYLAKKETYTLRRLLYTFDHEATQLMQAAASVRQVAAAIGERAQREGAK